MSSKILKFNKETRKKLIEEGENHLLYMLTQKIAELSKSDIQTISINQIDTAYKLLKDMRNIMRPIDEEVPESEIRELSVILPDDWGIN